jgi:hypothetical protein
MAGVAMATAAAPAAWLRKVRLFIAMLFPAVVPLLPRRAIVALPCPAHEYEAIKKYDGILMKFLEAVKRQTRRMSRRHEERFGALPAIGAAQMIKASAKAIVARAAASVIPELSGRTSALRARYCDAMAMQVAQ